MKTIRVTAILLAMTLTGCGSFFQSDQPAPNLYILNSLVAPEEHYVPEATPSGTIYIETPTLPPGYDTERIVVVKAGRELDYLAGAEWSGQLSEVLQSYLRESYENRLPLGSVVEEKMRQEADTILSVTVRAFDIMYFDYDTEEPPQVFVQMVFALYDRNTDQLLDKIVATQVIELQENSVRKIVAALEGALADVTEESLNRLFRG